MQKFLLFICILLLSYSAYNQGQLTEEEAAFNEEMRGYRKDARVALKPYRYDGSKTTYFTYKSYEYIKEVEVATIQNAEYRLSFNSNGIHHNPIEIRIYDMPEGTRGRTLLYSRSNVAGDDFKFQSTEMLEKYKEAKKAEGMSEEALEHLRLKKIYVNYVIPAVDRETEEDPHGGGPVLILLKGAIVLCVGYLNM